MFSLPVSVLVMLRKVDSLPVVLVVMFMKSGHLASSTGSNVYGKWTACQ